MKIFRIAHLLLVLSIAACSEIKDDARDGFVPDPVTESADQKDDTDGQQNGRKVGKGKVGKFDFGACTEKIMEKFPHMDIPS